MAEKGESIKPEKVECSDFDPKLYVSETYFDNAVFVRAHKYVLQKFHQFLIGSKPGLKILEVGAGPVMVHAISAAQYASEIVLSEYSDNFRSALQKWVDGDPTAHDWSMYFKYVVEDLEGKTEKDAKERETQLRKAIKAVVPCDVTKDPLLPPEYMGQYDLVTTVACLEIACRTRDSYKAAIGRIFKLLKPGGRIVMFGAEKDAAFESAVEGVELVIGNQGYSALAITREFVKETLEDTGFSDVQLTVITKSEMNFTVDTPMKSFLFVSGVKQ